MGGEVEAKGIVAQRGNARLLEAYVKKGWTSDNHIPWADTNSCMRKLGCCKFSLVRETDLCTLNIKNMIILSNTLWQFDSFQ